jgi:3-ketosteroid 9alpha-monooxygenase subunit A
MTQELSTRTAKRPRFPLPRYPTGWFFVHFSRDLPSGGVVPKEVFGQQLVLFRGEDGTASLLDAFCPHMGAHLGHGGTVEGNCVKCPFHAWRFDASGQCIEVPYAKKVPPKAKLRKWEIRERGGMIYAWHHIDGEQPAWELPEIPELTDPAWLNTAHRNWKVRTHNQEMGENAVDVAHFRYLHGTQNFPEAKVEFGFPVLHMRADTGMQTPKGKVDGTLETHSYGFGLATNRFSGLVDTLLVATQTPLDEDFVDVHFNFYVKKIGNEDMTRGVGKAFVAEIARQLEQDIPVWEHKIYVHPPALCDGDGPVGHYRKWSRQFYPEHYLKAAEQAFLER